MNKLFTGTLSFPEQKNIHSFPGNGLSGVLNNEASFQNFYRNFTKTELPQQILQQTPQQFPTQFPQQLFETRMLPKNADYGSAFAARYQNNYDYEVQELDLLRQDIESAYQDSEQKLKPASTINNGPNSEQEAYPIGLQTDQNMAEKQTAQTIAQAKEAKGQQKSEAEAEKKLPSEEASKASKSKKPSHKNAESLVSAENSSQKQEEQKNGKKIAASSTEEAPQKEKLSQQLREALQEGKAEKSEKAKPASQISSEEALEEEAQKKLSTKNKSENKKTQVSQEKSVGKAHKETKPQIQVIDERSTAQKIADKNAAEDTGKESSKELSKSEFSKSPDTLKAVASEILSAKPKKAHESELLDKSPAIRSSSEGSRNKLLKKNHQQHNEGMQQHKQPQEQLQMVAKQQGSATFIEGDATPQTSSSTNSPVLRSFAQNMAQRLQEGPLAQNLRQLQFRLFDQNRGEIRLRLNPESLGNVRIHLNISGSQLAGHIVTETAEAARIMQEHLQYLESSLRDGGFENQGFQVSVSGGQAGDSGAAAQDNATSLPKSSNEETDWEDLTETHIVIQQEQSEIDFSA